MKVTAWLDRNYSLFITNALPGEKIKFVVTKVGKSFGFGRVLEHNHFPDRAEIDARIVSWLKPAAPLQHMVYQLNFALSSIKSITAGKKKTDLSVSETIRMDTLSLSKQSTNSSTDEWRVETGFFRQHL